MEQIHGVFGFGAMESSTYIYGSTWLYVLALSRILLTGRQSRILQLACWDKFTIFRVGGETFISTGRTYDH